MKSRCSYDDLARYYDLFTEEDPDDAPLYQRYIRSGDHVLEIGVGTGRVAFELARKLPSIRIDGIDYSKEMLEIAKKKANHFRGAARIAFIHMDMREMNLSHKYDVVLVPYLTFQFAITLSDQINTLRGIARALRKGGRCLIHLYHPDPSLIAIRGWKKELRHSAFDRRASRTVHWITRSRMNRVNQTISYEVIYRMDDPDNHDRELRFKQVMRFTYRYEMQHLAASVGLKTQNVFGDFSGAPLCSRSRDMIFVLGKE